MAPLRVALSAFALLAGAAASSAAAQAPAVAEATPNPSTLADAALVDPKAADTTSTADRRALAKKRGCNPKKNTSCCRAPRRPPPAALGEIYPADMPTPSSLRAGDRKSKCAKQVFGNPLKPWKPERTL